MGRSASAGVIYPPASGRASPLPSALVGLPQGPSPAPAISRGMLPPDHQSMRFAFTAVFSCFAAQDGGAAERTDTDVICASTVNGNGQQRTNQDIIQRFAIQSKAGRRLGAKTLVKVKTKNINICDKANSVEKTGMFGVRKERKRNSIQTSKQKTGRMSVMKESKSIIYRRSLGGQKTDMAGQGMPAAGSSFRRRD